jgi:hypothetical protein
VDQALVAQVVQATVLEDLGTGLEPDGLTEGDAVLGQQLGGDAAQSAEHGPAGVDHLDLPVLGEGLGVGGQTSSVPAIVTGELAGQVGRGVTLAEGACREGRRKRIAAARGQRVRSLLLGVLDAAAA